MRDGSGSAGKGATQGNTTALRFATALPIIPVIIFLLYWAPAWGFRTLVFVAVTICGAELMSMTLPESRAARVLGVLSTIGLSVAIVLSSDVKALIATLAGMVCATLAVALASPEPAERAAKHIAWGLAGPLYVGGLLSSIALLHDRPYGGSWVLLSMMVAWLSDTGAYFAGRAFGNTALYPAVSPGKTVEGSLGGLAGSVVGALIAHFALLPVLPLVDAVILALAAGALGQAGDLFESLIKRSTGVKDSGTILPGHGGLLDRVDALMFVSAATWLYASWILPMR